METIKADPKLQPRLKLGNLLPLIVTAIVGWQSWNRRGTVSLWMLIILAIIALMTVLSFTVLPWLPLLTGSRIAVQAAARRRAWKCPACAYDLPRDLQGEFAICSECGAAWKSGLRDSK